ncbi:hypothetical protein GCM10022247_42070 [Allokutzneria multivorans]|uniref:WXG100 family type VII secretion target n=1 Tax=Allokutzneria multivorans TaxID=1142134 RepID=A0ABP7SPR1_9PSEU
MVDDARINDLKAVLAQLADRAEQHAGHAEALWRAQVATLNELTATWEGSRHDASCTARGLVADAVGKLDGARSRLHRTVVLLRVVAAAL